MSAKEHGLQEFELVDCFPKRNFIKRLSINEKKSNFQEVSKLFPKLAPLVLPSQCQPSARFGDTSRQPRRWGQFRIEGGHFSTDDGNVSLKIKEFRRE